MLLIDFKNGFRIKDMRLVGTETHANSLQNKTRMLLKPDVQQKQLYKYKRAPLYGFILKVYTCRTSKGTS